VEVKVEVDKRELLIKEKQQFHDGEHDNNKELDKKISMAERITGKMRLDLQDAERAQDQLQSEVSTRPRTRCRVLMRFPRTKIERSHQF
jgi:hypothetical protein